jgi:hypothetical protein
VFHQECSDASGRVTYVVDKEGKIIMILTVCWLLSIPKALEAVKIDSSKSR